VDPPTGSLELAQQKAAEAGVELEGFVHANDRDMRSFPALEFPSDLHPLIIPVIEKFKRGIYSHDHQTLDNPGIALPA
jgi:hypothetical protein